VLSELLVLNVHIVIGHQKSRVHSRRNQASTSVPYLSPNLTDESFHFVHGFAGVPRFSYGSVDLSAGKGREAPT
jgi:hypothetical protein